MKQTLFTILSTAVIFYFTWHSLYGQTGLFHYLHIKQELETQKTKLDQLKLERITLENRSRLLRPDSIDKDLIDEIARKSLGLVSSLERVIIVDENNKAE